MRVFGFAGWSGSGKTTLIEQLIPRLVARGLRVSLVKHAHLGFEIDHPGKDSYRHREAGCTEVLISSGRRWAVVHELRGAPELTLEAALGRLSPCDLVLVEGYKRLPLPKLEIHRSEVGKPWLHPDDPTIVAIASDVPPAVAAGRVLFALNAFDKIATFIVERAAPAASLVDAGSAPGVA